MNDRGEESVLEVNAALDVIRAALTQPEGKRPDEYAASRLPNGAVLICRAADGPCRRVAEGCSQARCLWEEGQPEGKRHGKG